MPHLCFSPIPLWLLTFTPLQATPQPEPVDLSLRVGQVEEAERDLLPALARETEAP